MLTPEALAELRRLLDAATPGPWMVDDEGDDVAVIVDEGDEFSFIQIAADLHQGDDGLTDARLIAAAVNALPALLDAAAERDALAAKVERVRVFAEQMVSDCDDGYADGYELRPYAGELLTILDAELRAALDEEPQP